MPRGFRPRNCAAHTQRLLVNKIVAMRYVFGAKKSRLGDLLSLKGLSSVHIQGEKLVSLAFPEGVAKRVEDTLIPFKVITTDFERLEERVITEGPMVQAVAASIAIPGVISGPKIDGRIHVDGGVCNPVPFDHVRAGCDLVVAVDVTGRPRSTGRIHPTNRELALGSMFIMFHQIARLQAVGVAARHLCRAAGRPVQRQSVLPLAGIVRRRRARQGMAEAGAGKPDQEDCVETQVPLNRLAAVLEKLNQQGAGRFGADAAIDFGTMMAGRLLEEARAVLDRAHLLVRRAEIEPADAGEGNGGGAHGARLERHIEIAIGEPLAAELAGRLADRQQFGMGGRVAVGERAVAGRRRGSRPARSVMTQPTGHLATPSGGFGFGQGMQHRLWQFERHRGSDERASGAGQDERIRG